MQLPFSPAFSILLLSSAFLVRGHPDQPSATATEIGGDPTVTVEASLFPRGNFTRPLDLWCSHPARPKSEQSWCDHPVRPQPEAEQPKTGLPLPAATTDKLGLPIPIGEGGCAVCVTGTDTSSKPKKTSDIAAVSGGTKRTPEVGWVVAAGVVAVLGGVLGFA